MSATSLTYRWTQQAFLRATEADVFEGRVGLVDPDAWVCPAAVVETGWLSPRISTWSPSGCRWWRSPTRHLTPDTLHENTRPTSDLLGR